MRKIISIEEKDFTAKVDYNHNYSGYIITCDDGSVVKVGIDNIQDCCENWGYVASEDCFSDFIGALLYNVIAVDTKLGTYDVPDIYEGGCMFVNVETSEGTLQFTMYNEHNGYYSHDAVIVENGFCRHQEYL